MAASGLYDLVFDPSGTAGIGPLGLMLQRGYKDGHATPAKFEGGYSPAEADDPTSIQTIPEIQLDFSGGALYTKRIIPNGYAYTAPGFARSARGVTPPGAQTETTLPAPTPALGSITDSFDLLGNKYFLAGRYVLVSAGGSSDTLTVEKDLGVGFVADGAAVFGGAAYIGGSGGNIWKLSSLGVWSQSADVSHRKAAVITWLIPSEGLMRARLVMGTSDLLGIRYTGGDPMSLANWTPNPSSIAVDDGTYPLTSIVAAPNHVYLPTQAGLCDLNSRGETINLTPDIRRGQISSDNGAASLYHNSFVHLSHVNGAHRVDVSTGRRQYGAVWTLPPFGVTNETPIVGPVVAWGLDQGWILALLYNAGLDRTYLGSMRNRGEPGVPDGPGAMLAHFAEAVLSGRGTHLTTSVVGGLPRIWMATRQGTNTSLVWQYSPNATNPIGELANETDFRFGTSLVMYTTHYDWQDPDAVKILRVIGLRGDHLGVTAGVAVSANAEGGSFTLQSTARTSPRTRISPRSPLTHGHEIGLLLVGSGSATLPPVIRTVKLDAEMVVEQFDRRQYPIKAGKGQTLRGGATDQRNPAVVWAAAAALHKADDVIEMWDAIEKSTSNVRVHPISGYSAVEDTAFAEAYSYAGILPVTVLVIVSGSAATGAQWGDGTKWGDSTLWAGG